MAQQFLHGVETVNIPNGPRPVTEVKTAIIGLIGIAPLGPKNKLTLVKNDVDAAQFGSELPGFDIPQALNFIFGHNAGTVIVVNVFDEVAHTSNVVDEQIPIANGKLKLGFAPIGAVTIKNADGTASALVKGTDYTLDDFGKLVVIAGRIANGTNLKFSYKKLNVAALTDAQIVGTVGGDGNRTGIKALDLSSSMFGFRPKILVVPGRSGKKAIFDEMLSAAERLKAVALIDSTFGDDVQTTITNRGDATKSFGTSDMRAILCYPYLKGYDINKDDGGADTDTNTDFPYSMFYAGLMAWTDKNFGYWDSPSNYEFKGVTGMERPISANLNDADTDTNALNAAGIVTIFNSFGTGFRAWGNRNASYPTNTQEDNFIALLRTFDVVHESLEMASLPYVDRKITNAMIDDVLHSGNDFIAILVGRGALTQGSRVVFDKAENTPAQLSDGQLVLTIIKDAPAPAERITYKSVIDISLKSRAIG
jgi:phage tail sheath protein FI